MIGVAVLVCALVAPLCAQEDNQGGRSAKQATMSGYVVDAMCAKGMMKKDAPMDKAAAHTRECALNDACAASGDGLVSDVKYYMFDSDGSTKAKDLIDHSSRTDHLYVEVMGNVKDDMLTVASISEKDPPATGQ